MTENSISVSDIVTCSICPMQSYLSKSMGAYAEPISYSIAKQISYHLGAELDEKIIWNELKDVIPECGDEARKIMNDMITSCSRSVWRRAVNHDVSVRSEKYNIYGRVDRLFDDTFSIIKAGSAPSCGVYAPNRLQAVCYQICLEEMFGSEFYGTVEYLGSGTIRNVLVNPSDKRMFIESLKAAEKIQRGEIPNTRRGSACAKCRFNNVCRASEKPMSLFERLKKSDSKKGRVI
ncbi:MAG TPA: Dna2/Cas4 domain-containing protein [Methanocorpusculum sp.]|nr:Dna2/Cas4 domain-containing protein [Methanocorpusculum sp.]